MKKILTIAFVLLSSLAFTNPITQTVRGIVTDKLTKMPIPGANIVIINSSPLKGTTTDDQGRFRINEVEIGRVSMKITFVGHP